MTNLPENCLENYSIVLNFDNKMVKILAAEYDPNMFIKKLRKMGGSPAIVVMGGDSCSEGRGFESRFSILDGDIFTNICCNFF